MSEEQIQLLNVIIYLAPPIVGAVISLLGGLAVHELRQMRRSVDSLNTRVAIVIEKVNGHERRIGKLEKSK